MDNPHPDATSGEASNNLDLEIRAAEARVKMRELDVRGIEAEAAAKAASAPWWRNANPLVIAVVGGVVTLAGNAFVAYYNGYTTREQDKVRAENALTVEKEKDQAALILQAIATNDPAKAYANIQFFISSGMLADDDHKIRNAAEAYAPFLPSPGGTPGKIPEERLEQLAQSGLTLGVIVSKWNGPVDFALLKAHNIAFAYIRATSGTVIDGAADQSANLAAANGLKVGLYHFFEPNADVATQVATFVGRLKSIHWDIPPVIDSEEDPSGSIPPDYAERVEKFGRELELTFGVKPIIYATAPFATKYLDSQIANYPLFVADVSPQGVAPRLPKWWTSYLFWHLAFGVDGDPTLSHFDIVEFNGSPTELAALNKGRK